jgi:hypothetical protein
MGDPASSYTTAGIAFRILWPRKAHYYIKVEMPSRAGGRRRIWHKSVKWRGKIVRINFMKGSRGSRGTVPLILPSTLVWGQWSF